MEYYDLFIKLSLQLCTKEDYIDKRKVKQHNVAMKKLEHLRKEIKQQNNYEALNSLLKHKDERVRLNAASWCVKEGVFVDQAVSVLELIMNDCTDETFSFTAEILLKNLD